MNPVAVLLGLALLLVGQSPSASRDAPTRTVADSADHLTLDLPQDWQLSRRDRELSTFREEVCTAPRHAHLRLVAAMPENPFPESTFSGAHLYLSLTPNQTPAQCVAQAGPPAATDQATIGQHSARHGHDQHGVICTQFRDEIYTLPRANACLRFDLTLNNFCGGEVSGVHDLTPAQIATINQRLQTILATVHFQR